MEIYKDSIDNQFFLFALYEQINFFVLQLFLILVISFQLVNAFANYFITFQKQLLSNMELILNLMLF